MEIVYGICLIVSIAVVVFMAQKNYENIDVQYWSIVIMIPLIILGYWLKTRVTTTEGAMITYCFIYMDSTVLLMVVIFSMLRSLEIHIKPWLKGILYNVAFAHLFLVWVCSNNNLYYESIEIVQTDLGASTVSVPGPLKIVHYIYLIGVWLAILSIIIAGFLKKGTHSLRTLTIYAIITGTGLAVYLAESLMQTKFTFLPVLYVITQLILAADYDYAHTHDISCLISEQQKYHGQKGYVAVSLSKRFLSCNKKVYEILPEISNQRVDSIVNEETQFGALFYGLIEDLENKKGTSRMVKIEDAVFACDISRFTIRKDGRPQGYLFELRDATEEQKALEVMTAYNETLNNEVADKTKNIRDIQRKITLGMANMIENRDNNTGGHVKRTSDIIKILVEEIKKQSEMDISDALANDIVRAAPMHDLGKITIDSNILCKPSRLTDEEYAIMKTHSTKSGEMVKILLEGVEEEHFVDTAFNVARYHHERWDGRGYPEGLVGNMIPVEARIMAVADVYDALVSKRCYKEPMSFEKASEIMCEGMGTQFDPNMKSIFKGCRKRLEEYYIEDTD